MKDEPRNRSVWERMKMAFRLLFSVKALEPVYKEGWEDGRRGLYDDYKVMKETIGPSELKLKPRSAESIWSEETPMSMRAPSTASQPIPSSAASNSL